MAILRIEHRVRDFDRWKQGFDSDPAGRQQNGVRRYRVARGTDDPNAVTIDLEFDAADQAEAFGRKLEELWGRVGEELGLEDPRTLVLELVDAHEFSPSS